ncbi:MAG: AAA family ATPase [Candidatus Lokiarchaeota archaeon]|jgi:adenylate kinase|nr:AAA family ATPase [Candidatus Lokiarchaeota archaeon]
MQILIVSGTPGTGKTTISNNLTNFIEAKVISLNELAISENLIEKFDTKRETSIIDTNKLIRFLIELIEDYEKKDPEFLIIESHFSDIVPEQYINFVIILRCDPDELYTRLSRRGYKKEKIRENVQSEILGNSVNYFINKPLNTPILEIDTSKVDIESITKTIVGIITNKIDIKDFYVGKIDWLEKLFQENRLQMFFD